MDGRLSRTGRVAWTVVTGFFVESLVLGLSVLPAAIFWTWHLEWNLSPAWLRIVVASMSFVPAYLIFAVALMALSALSTRLLGWRTPADVELRVRDLEWPLLDWVRYLVSTHVVRLFAGMILRSTPMWTWYHRWNGARIGRGVWINSISLMDHNLLEFGDRVVIGSDAHVSGHMVEGGVVKTGRIRLGDDVTVGVNAVVGIGVEVGEGAQIGALTIVPKGRRVEAGSVWRGRTTPNP